MNFLRKLFPTKNAKLFMKAADKCFDEVCSGVGNSSAAEIYRAHPNVKVKQWKEIRAELANLVGTGDGPDLTKRLRHEWAKRLDLLVLAHFYTNLDTDDREAFAKFVCHSDLATQDHYFYFDMAYAYTFASVLDGIILNSWDGPIDSIERLKKHKDNFISSSQDYYQLSLEVAYRKRDGIESTEEEKEAGKSIYYMKEFTRRALAGEEIFDQ